MTHRKAGRSTQAALSASATLLGTLALFAIPAATLTALRQAPDDALRSIPQFKEAVAAPEALPLAPLESRLEVPVPTLNIQLMPGLEVQLPQAEAAVEAMKAAQSASRAEAPEQIIEASNGSQSDCPPLACA